MLQSLNSEGWLPEVLCVQGEEFLTSSFCRMNHMRMLHKDQEVLMFSQELYRSVLDLVSCLAFVLEVLVLG